jgi:hypothetical protein
LSSDLCDTHQMAACNFNHTKSLWSSLKQRCRKRGIQLCERWQTFENFLADMGPRPPNAQLHRMRRSGAYEPGNCEWLTPYEHACRHGAAGGIGLFEKDTKHGR